VSVYSLLLKHIVTFFLFVSASEIVFFGAKLNHSRMFVDPILLNLTFAANQIYHRHGIAYDYYSKDDPGQSKAGDQWKIWPLPSQTKEISPIVLSKLPFIDAIYVMTDPRLTDRHASLRNVFHRQSISTDLIDWRMKWNRTTCTSNASHSYVYQRLHLEDKPLGNSLC
jgi:hypothetical protein